MTLIFFLWTECQNSWAGLEERQPDSRCLYLTIFLSSVPLFFGCLLHSSELILENTSIHTSIQKTWINNGVSSCSRNSLRLASTHTYYSRHFCTRVELSRCVSCTRAQDSWQNAKYLLSYLKLLTSTKKPWCSPRKKEVFDSILTLMQGLWQQYSLMGIDGELKMICFLRSAVSLQKLLWTQIWIMVMLTNTHWRTTDKRRKKERNNSQTAWKYITAKIFVAICLKQTLLKKNPEMETKCSCNKASLGAQIRIKDSAWVRDSCLELVNVYL